MDTLGGRPTTAKGHGSLTFVRAGTGGEWVLDGATILSRTLVEVQVTGGGWVPGLFLWSGKADETPVIRLLITSRSGAAPTPVDLPLPASAAIRRAKHI